MTTIRVLLADDQELVRRGFGALIDAEDGLEVVGEAATGAEAIDQAFATRPDVILMDIRMPELDGIAATARITADDRLSDTRVLVLTTFDLDQYVYDALRAGASGFPTQRHRTPTTPRCHPHRRRRRRPHRTGNHTPAHQRVRRHAPTRPQVRPASRSLTPRERDVLIEVGQGHNNAEIAERLFISPLTAKTHVSRIMTKLAARDRARLVVIAYETGLVTPGD